MLRSIVSQLRKNPAAFFRIIAPLTRERGYSGPVLGWDTEYDSRTSSLVCYQLALADGSGPPWPSLLSTDKLTVDGLAKSARRLIGSEAEEVYLVSFFSIAELQFLPVRTEAFAWREYGAGSFDCSFYSDKETLTLHVFDLARFFDRQSLARVATAFGLEKKEWDRKQVTKADLKSPRFREYALHDAGLVVEILRLLRLQFQPWGVDPLVEKTAASTAATVFRRGWVHEPIRCDNNQARLAGMLACWGGRAEALARGSFPKVYEYDLASAYPNAVLALGELPCEGSWKPLTNLRNLDRWRGGMLRVIFRFPSSEMYPCLPVVLETCQLYPREGAEWVTLAEVKLALEWGADVELVDGWAYTKGTTVLRDYLAEMLEARKHVEGAQKVAYKLLCNALIGKLAQRANGIPLEELRQKASKAGILEQHARTMGAKELEALGVKSELHIGAVFFPEWNALITGHVRARIARLVRETEAIYCATDAVWTERKLTKPPPDLELKRSGSAIVARTRLGLIDEGTGKVHVAHHSIWNRKAAETALRNLEVGFLRYPTRRPIKLKESLRSGKHFGEWVEEWRTADTYWDGKRKLLADGSTIPWKDVEEYEAELKRTKKSRKEAARTREKGRNRSRAPAAGAR